MAKRISPPAAESGGEAAAGAKRLAGLLLPASIDRVWAVEIVFEGKLHRFERDGAGNWLLHVGQHTHSGDMAAHVADPAQARVIATALGGPRPDPDRRPRRASSGLEPSSSAMASDGRM